MAANGVTVASDVNYANLISMSGNEPASRRRLRSLVWNDFTKERTADGNYVAICNHCKKQLSASSRSGTTHLKNHLSSCLNTKVRKRRKLVVRRLVLNGDNGDGSTVDLSTFDQDVSRQDLARMIVYQGYPFNIVHDMGFKAFVRNLQPQFKFISEEEVKNDCMKIFMAGKNKLHTLLGNLACRVNLTIDMWRSGEDLEYVCLTCHYIDDDWKLRRKILNFLHVETSNPGEDIGKTVDEKLHEWNLHKKLFSVVADNCNDSDVVAREIPENVLLKGSLQLNGEFFNVRSATSVINVMAHHVTISVNDVISKMRDSVHYVRSSLEKSLNISDAQNNWVTTYLMLESACECQAEYTNVLSSEEWEIAKVVTDGLDVFYRAIEKFSKAKILTSNLYFNDICRIHLLLKNWRVNTIPLIASIASQILENLEQYWGSTVLVTAIASILDPRYKFKSIEYFFSKIYDDKDEADARIENIRKYLVNLYNEYVIKSKESSNDQSFLCYSESNNNGNNTDLKDGSESKTSSRTYCEARKGLDQYLHETSSSQPQKSDFDLYFDEAVCLCKGSEDNFDILAWWRFHALKYPVLSTMARDILGSPVSVDGETRILNQYLSSLDPVTVQVLICGQDWLRDEFEVLPEPSLASNNVATFPLFANLGVGVDSA